MGILRLQDVHPASSELDVATVSGAQECGGVELARAVLFRMLLVLALLAGALASAPAAADVLVSNIGQQGGSSRDFLGVYHAQRFTTGSHAAGYYLESIELRMSVTGSLTEAERKSIGAELWSAAAGGQPGSRVAILRVPTTVATGAVAFTAPENTVLAADTRYYLVVYTFHFSLSKLKVAITNDNVEDAGAATGWSIADHGSYLRLQNPYLRQNDPNRPTWTTDTFERQIRVNGIAVQPPSRLTLTTDAAGGTAAEDAGAVSVTATLDRRATAAVSVTLAAGAASTATAADDYALPAAFTIARGETAATADVTIVDDDVDEGDETLVLTASVSGLATTPATLTITDDDDAGVTVSDTALSVAAGSTAAYTVVLDSRPLADVTVTPASGTADNATVSSAVTFTPDAWDTAQRITVTGVRAGTSTVTHALTSSDATYSSLSADPVTVTVTAVAPGAPTELLISAEDARLDLSWTAPGNDGGSAIAGYDVHYTSAPKSGGGAVADDAAVQTGGSPSAAAGWVAVNRGTENDPPTASQTLSSLSNDTTYRVRVRAKNTAGESDWVTGSGTPQQSDTTGPAAPTFDPADGTTTADAGTNITLMFSEAVRKDASDTDFTGHADLSVVLTLKTDNASGADISYAATINSAGTLITIDPVNDLSDGVVYAAISDGYYDANGNQGAAASATFTVDTPSTDATLSGLAASGGTSDTGTFSSLELTPSPFASATERYTASVARSVTHTRLTPTASEENATVKAGKSGSLAAVESGAASGPIALEVGANALKVEVTAEDGVTRKTYTVTVTREAAPPGAPTGLLVSAGDARLDLSWTAPSDDGGAAIEGYDVQYTSASKSAVADDAAVRTGGSVSSADGWVAVGRGAEADPPAASQAISGLANDTEYRVRVRARNAGGNGAWAHGTGSPQPADTTGPSAPAFVPGDGDTVTNAGTNITLTFTEAVRKDADNSDFTGYADLSAILTLARTSAVGTAIPYTASINAEKTVITIDPTGDLADGVVHVGISGAHYDKNGNAGSAASATFTVAAAPARSPNANLGALTASTSTSSGGTFTALDIGTFSASTTSYTASAAYDRTHLKLTPTVADTGKATVGVRKGTAGGFTTVTSGSASGEIPLSVGANAITVRVTAEDRTEKDYTVTVTRQARTQVQPPATVTLSASPNPVTEGEPVTVTATLSRALSRTVAIPLTITDGTAESADHGTLPGIRVAAGATSGTGRIATRQDDDTDDETFTVAVDTDSLPSTVAAGAVTLVVVTIDDDDDTSTVGLSVKPRNAVRPGDSVTVTAKLSKALSSDVFIPLTLKPDSEPPTTSADYGTLSGITIIAGETSGTGTIATVPDENREYESFRVLLGDLPAGLGRGIWWVRVTIAPKHVPRVWLTVPETVDEGKAVTVTARLDEALSADVRIPVTARLNDGPAAHYEIPVAAGATSGTLGIPTPSDDDSSHETLIVEIDRRMLPAVEPEVRVWVYSRDYPTNAVVSVLDRPALTTVRASAREAHDDAVTFTVRLSYVAIDTVTVDYATADAAGAWQGAQPAAAGADYTAVSGTLTFLVGQTERKVSVPVLDDAVDEGTEHFLLRLSNPQGAYVKAGHAETHGLIANDDPLPGAWLSRFGRTVAGHHVAAIRDRLAADRGPGVSARFAGQPLPQPRDGVAQAADADGMRTSPETRVARDASAAGAVLYSRTAPGDADALSDPDGDDTLAFRSLRAFLAGDGDEGEASVQAVAADDVLLGTEFVMTRDAGHGLSHGFWGRVSRSGFSGREGAISVDGTVTGVLLGTDWKRKGMTFGVIVSESRGSMTYGGASSGAIDARLSALVPWAGLEIGERSSLWGAAGIGRGDMTLRPDDQNPTVTGIGWSMAALGAEGAPAPGARIGGASLGWHADALATRTNSDAVPGLAAGSGRTTRMRLGITAAWERTLANGATLSPRLEAGVRHDGGDAETGIGLEVGGAIAFVDPARGLSMTVDARTLALHEDGNFRDWGLSLGLSWDPRPETKRGCSATAQHGLGGASAGGVDALFGPEAFPGAPGAEGGSGWSVEAACGTGRGRGMVGSPYARASGGGEAESLRVGYRIEPDADHAEDATVQAWADPSADGGSVGAGLEWKW